MATAARSLCISTIANINILVICIYNVIIDLYIKNTLQKVLVFCYVIKLTECIANCDIWAPKTSCAKLSEGY